MSGPKVSVYSLTPEQRAAIRAERIRQQRMREQLRKEEEEKRRIERARVSEFRGKLKKLSEEVNTAKGQMLAFERVIDEVSMHIQGSNLRSRADAAGRAIEQLLESVGSSVKLGDSQSLEAAHLAASEKLQGILEECKSIEQDLSRNEVEMQDVLTEKISEFFQQPAASEAGQKHESAQIDEATLAALSEASYFAGQGWLPQNLKRELDEMTTRTETTLPAALRSLVEIQVRPLLKRCDQYRKTWEKYGEEYQNLCRQYEALAEMNGHADTVEMVPFGEDAVLELKRRIAAEEAQAQEDAEKAYIASALDEVMEEMGYSIWGHREVTKRSGKHFSNSLYHYGHDAAINVMRSDDGQITMELGRLDTKDRLPSAAEAKELAEEMGVFCTDFAEIEKRLAARGVVVGNRVSMAPPSEAYAQIININDYERMDRALAVGHEERRTVKQGKRTQAETIG